MNTWRSVSIIQTTVYVYPYLPLVLALSDSLISFLFNIQTQICWTFIQEKMKKIRCRSMIYYTPKNRREESCPYCLKSAEVQYCCVLFWDWLLFVNAVQCHSTILFLHIKIPNNAFFFSEHCSVSSLTFLFWLCEGS